MAGRFLFIIFALLLGAFLPIQATINGRLAKIAGSPIISAFVSFAVGTIVLFLFLLFSGQLHWQGGSIKQHPWWIWIGGILGTFFVAGIVVLLPRLGVALSFGLVVTGQMFAALLFDHFGWLGTEVKEISLGRIIGALLLIGGVVLIRKF